MFVLEIIHTAVSLSLAGNSNNIYSHNFRGKVWQEVGGGGGGGGGSVIILNIMV